MKEPSDSRSLVNAPVSPWFAFVAAIFFLFGSITTGKSSELSNLFGGKAPAVLIEQREANIRTEDGNGIKPCLLSIGEGIAITTEEIIDVDYVVLGQLTVWDLKTGRIRHTIKFPARIGGIVRLPDERSVIVAGGPVNKDMTPPFLATLNLETGTVTNHPEPVIGSLYLFQLRIRNDGKYVGTRNGTSGIGIYENKSSRYTLVQEADKNDPVWGKFPETSAELANQLPKIPLKIEHIGDRDRGFALAEDKQGVGVWRTDTWELVMRLGANAPWENWVPSPDGMTLLTWRHDIADGFTVWDLENLRVVSIQEPGFQPVIAPAISEDGEWIRYRRKSVRTGKTEIVSRNWKTSELQVAVELPRDEFDYADGAQIKGAFSPNGAHLLLSPGDKERARRISWDAAGEADIKEFAFPLKAPFAINDGGSLGCVEGSQVENDGTTFAARTINLNTRKQVENWKVTTVGHPPRFFGSFHPADSGIVALGQYTSGASLRYYLGDVISVKDGKGTLIPGFKLRKDTIPRGKEAHGWSCQFTTVNGKDLLGVYANNGRFVSYNTETNRTEHEILWDDYNPNVEENHGRLMTRIIASQRGRVFLPLQHGGIRVVDLLPGGISKQVAELWSLPDKGWFMVTPEGYYAVSVGSEKFVFFQQENSVTPFQQFDAFLNRPDKLAEAFGSDRSVVDTLAKVHQKRLTSLNLEAVSADDFLTVPQLQVDAGSRLVSDQSLMEVSVKAQATGGAELTHLHVQVNGVPLFSSSGLSIPISSGKRYSQTHRIPLEPGENLLEVSVANSKGIESPTVGRRIHRSSPNHKADLYLLAIGVADYQDDDWDLTYAAKDARDIANKFPKAGLGFGNVFQKVVTDQQATRAGVLQAREFLQQSRTGDRIVIFIAGHGTLDDDYTYYFCPHDNDFDNPAAKGITIADIESLFENVAARERLLLLDTCHAGSLSSNVVTSLNSGETSLPRGIRAIAGRGVLDESVDEGSQRFVDELFSNLKRGIGATVISASGGLEFANESDDWKNGVFTYSILAALEESNRVDQNKDGVVSASELLARVSSDVVDLTGGIQNPGNRSVNRTMDIPVVETKSPSTPEDPADFLKRYLKWSSVDLGQLGKSSKRITELFASSVSYFGDKLSPSQIQADMEGYNGKYYERKYTLQGIEHTGQVTEGASSTATLDYTMDFRVGYDEVVKVNIPGRGLTESKQRKSRNGTLKMRMELIQEGSEWRISGLQTRK